MEGREPDAAEKGRRRAKYWQPYHDALAVELERIRAAHGYVVLWDAHSIRAEIPWLFEGVLPDLNIGTQSGTTNFDPDTSLLLAARIQAFEQFPFAVQALMAGDVDAVIIDETAGLGYVGVNPDHLKLVGESMSSDQLGIIFPKGSDLVAPMNAGIASLKQDGFLDFLMNKWFFDYQPPA